MIIRLTSLGKCFQLKAKQEGFQVDANVAEILAAYTSPAWRKNMNAPLVRILFHESVEEASNRLPLNATLSQLMELKKDNVVAACARLPSVPEGDSSSWIPYFLEKVIILPIRAPPILPLPLRCFDMVFQRPYWWFSIVLKVILSLSVLEIIHMVLSTKMVFKHLKPKIRKKGPGAFLGKYEKLH